MVLLILLIIIILLILLLKLELNIIILMLHLFVPLSLFLSSSSPIRLCRKSNLRTFNGVFCSSSPHWKKCYKINFFSKKKQCFKNFSKEWNFWEFHRNFEIPDSCFSILEISNFRLKFSVLKNNYRKFRYWNFW